jgi:hypothetical protein
MDAEEMLKELYEELVAGSIQVTDWEETFINDVYEKVWEDEWTLTEAQEDKVEQIYGKYLG